MRGRAVWAFGAGAAWWLASSVASAQCTKDTDCKGDRVCEAGKCTSPLPPAPPPPPATADPSAPAADPSAAAQPTAADSSTAAQPNAAEPPPAPRPARPQAAPAPAAATAPLKDEPQLERRSRGAMITGIIMISVGPLALLGALAAKSSQEDCDEELESDYPNHKLPTSERYRLEACDSYTVPLYVLGIGGAVLTAGGVPLVIYGAKQQPQQHTQLQVQPWATREAGGLKLRLSL